MKTFDEDSYKADLVPDNEYWKERPRISLKFLCYLAVGYDPKKFYSQLIHIEEHKKNWARVNHEISTIRLINKKLDKNQKKKISELKKQLKKHDSIISGYETVKYKILDEANKLFKTLKYQLNQSIYNPNDSYNSMFESPNSSVYLFQSITYPERDQVTLDPDIFANWFYYYCGSAVFPDVLKDYITSKEDIKPKLSSHINYNYYRYNKECKLNWERWKKEKKIKTNKYFAEMFPKEWSPNWDYWRSLEILPLSSLCYLAFNTDIKKILEYSESSDENNKSFYFQLVSLHKHVDQLQEQVKSYILAIKKNVLFHDSEYWLSIDSFTDILKDKDITYTADLLSSDKPSLNNLIEELHNHKKLTAKVLKAVKLIHPDLTQDKLSSFMWEDKRLKTKGQSKRILNNIFSECNDILNKS